MFTKSLEKCTKFSKFLIKILLLPRAEARSQGGELSDKYFLSKENFLQFARVFWEKNLRTPHPFSSIQKIWKKRPPLKSFWKQGPGSKKSFGTKAKKTFGGSKSCNFLFFFFHMIVMNPPLIMYFVNFRIHFRNMKIYQKFHIKIICTVHTILSKEQISHFNDNSLKHFARKVIKL